MFPISNLSNAAALINIPSYNTPHKFCLKSLVHKIPELFASTALLCVVFKIKSETSQVHVSGCSVSDYMHKYRIGWNTDKGYT